LKGDLVNTGSFARQGAIAVGFVLAAAMSASASFSNPAVIITATNQSGSGSMLVQLNEGVLANDTWTWSLAHDYVIRSDAGTVIGTVRRLDAFLDSDPQANVTFGVMAGTSDTTFTLSSGLVSFAPITNARGRASASISLTDLNGNGATLTGLGSGGSRYRANYNGAVPGGTAFTNLLTGTETAGSFASATFNDSTPGGPGFIPIAGTVTDMSAQYNFTLSANDSASGTSVFVIVPSAGTAGLLAMAGLVAFRRVRR
jgi:hypothetical protein